MDQAGGLPYQKIIDDNNNMSQHYTIEKKSLLIHLTAEQGVYCPSRQ
jgi:hypothetical protein